MDKNCPWLPGACHESSLSITGSIAAILSFSWVTLFTIYFIWTSIRISKSDYSKCCDDYAIIRQQYQELSEQVNQMVQRDGPEIINDTEALQEGTRVEQRIGEKEPPLERERRGRHHHRNSKNTSSHHSRHNSRRKSR